MKFENRISLKDGRECLLRNGTRAGDYLLEKRTARGKWSFSPLGLALSE